MVAVAVAVAGAVAAAATATAAVASRNNIIHGKALKRDSHACFKTQDQITVANMQSLRKYTFIAPICSLLPSICLYCSYNFIITYVFAFFV